MNRERVLEVLQHISDDAEADAMKLEGQLFNGRTMATNLGQIYASIQALANIIKAEMEGNDAAAQ
jgi:hypothetical protein